MIKIESFSKGMFAVIAYNKVLVTTSNYMFAKEVFDNAKNDNLDFAQKHFIPFKFPDPTTVTL